MHKNERPTRSTSLLSMMKLKGVWLSDRPLDANEGAKGEIVLAVALSVPLSSLADHELIEEGDRLYREWCVPARILNKIGTPRVQ